MPKLQKTEYEKRIINLKALIAYHRAKECIDVKTLGIKLGVKENAMHKKIQCPSRISYPDLVTLCKVLKFTDEEKAQIL